MPEPTKMYPEPWRYEARLSDVIGTEEAPFIVSNGHFNFFARQEAWAAGYVASHNRSEGWMASDQ